MIGTDIGGIATTKTLGPPPNGVSCEFANSTASKIVIVNIGLATPASFAILRTQSGGGGRTITQINGLGAEAFSTSKNGVPGGVAVLSTQGLVFSVTANLSIAQDESLIDQFMQQF